MYGDGYLFIPWSILDRFGFYSWTRFLRREDERVQTYYEGSATDDRDETGFEAPTWRRNKQTSLLEATQRAKQLL